MRARRLAALLLLAACLSLTGCWDHRELEEVGFILALGLDPAPGNQLVVTALVSVPGKFAGGKEGTGGGDQPHIISVVQAPDVASALNLMQTFTSRRPSLLHCKSLVVGDALARQGLVGPVNELVRFRQVRRTVSMIVTKGTAGDFLKSIKPSIERDPTRFIEILSMSGRYTGLVPDTLQMHEFAAYLHSHGGDTVTYLARPRRSSGEERPASHRDGQEKAPAAGSGPEPGEAPPLASPHFLPGSVPRSGPATVDINGAAVFRLGRLVDLLDGEEVRVLQMLRGQYYRSLFSLQDPSRAGQWLTVDLRRARPPQVQVSLGGRYPEIHNRIVLEAELVSQSGTTDFTRPEHRAGLEEALSTHLEREAAALHRKLQRAGSDVVRYGDQARHLFPTWDAWVAYNWRQKWTQARIDANFRVQLRRYGMQTQPLLPG